VLAADGTGGGLKTFTIDFDNPWRGGDVDLRYTRRLSAVQGTDHHEFPVNAADYSGRWSRRAGM
jgi:hypothetical protein